MRFCGVLTLLTFFDHECDTHFFYQKAMICENLCTWKMKNILGNDGKYWYVMGCNGMYWIVLGCAGIYWDVLWKYWDVLWVYWNLLRCTGMYWGVLGSTGEYWDALKFHSIDLNSNLYC